MVSTGISEFTFGFAFLFEQATANWSNLRAIPILPNLQEEANKGWDANIVISGVPFFYQFKLTEFLYKKNAKYRKDGTYTDSYFRISLHAHNHNAQHKKLRELSKLYPNTFYVAPEIIDYNDFNNEFLTQTIARKSRIIPVSHCDDINDSEQHFITFQKGISSWIQHSEAKKHNYSENGENLEEFYRKSKENWKKIDLEYSYKLLTETKNSVRNISEKNNENFDDLNVRNILIEKNSNDSILENLKQTSEILSAYFGASLVIVGERD